MNPTSEPIPEFGIKRDNEERRDGGCGIVFDPTTQLFAIGLQHADNVHRLFSGGVDANEDLKAGILREVVEESGLHDFAYTEEIGKAFAHYYNSLRKVNRVALATCYLVVLRSADVRPVQLEAHEQFSLAWISGDELLADWKRRDTDEGYGHWIYFMEKAIVRLRELGYVK